MRKKSIYVNGYNNKNGREPTLMTLYDKDRDRDEEKTYTMQEAYIYQEGHFIIYLSISPYAFRSSRI